jgi:class 3 adenylate cyclase
MPCWGSSAGLRFMKWFESVVAWLFPTILVSGTPWAGEWRTRDREAFVGLSRLVFPVLATGYILHYFFYDKAVGLEPLDHWLAFRVSIAALAMAGFVFYVTRLPERLKWYRAPAIFVYGVCAIAQAYVAKIHGQEAWVFCFMFVIGFAIVLRMSALNSLLFAAGVLSVQAYILSTAGLSAANILSGTVVTIGMVALIRSSYLSELKNFLLYQQHAAAQQKITDLNTEFTARIRAFIPSVIAHRLRNYIDSEGRTVLAAALDVLEPRKRDVACLFSDIRGYTQSSNDLDKFISKSAMPEIKACSDAIERHSGIPRKVGDLLFAYFDDEYIKLNILRAVAAGLEMARLNADMNATSTEMNVRRYILVSSGEAVVGNLGGLDSSVEITALGPPVNFLSRLDELTKDERLSTVLEPADILLCERSANLLSELNLDLELIRLDLRQRNLSVRDFPDTESIYILRPNAKNFQAVMEPYNYVRSRESKHAANGVRTERNAA